MILARAGLVPGNLDALIPIILISLLVWREVRRSATGPSTEPPARRSDRVVGPLVALFVIIVALQLGHML